MVFKIESRKKVKNQVNRQKFPETMFKAKIITRGASRKWPFRTAFCLFQFCDFFLPKKWFFSKTQKKAIFSLFPFILHVNFFWKNKFFSIREKKILRPLYRSLHVLSFYNFLFFWKKFWWIFFLVKIFLQESAPKIFWKKNNQNFFQKNNWIFF